MKPEMINGIFAIVGALIGAVVTAVLTRYFSKKAEKRNELTLISTEPTRFIKVSDKIAPKVEISVGGKKVKNIFASEINVVNSGNTTVYDAEIFVELKGNCEIANLEVERANFSISDNEDLAEICDDNKGRLFVKYLNPGDEVVARALLTDNPDSISLLFRKPEVKCIVKSNYTPEVPSVIVQALLDAMSSIPFFHVYLKFALPEYRKYIEANSRK